MPENEIFPSNNYRIDDGMQSSVRSSTETDDSTRYTLGSKVPLPHITPTTAGDDHDCKFSTPVNTWEGLYKDKRPLYNPFELKAENLLKDTVSPSLFAVVVSPNERIDKTFSWGIDQMATLNPADITNSPYAQFELPVDSDYEREAQKNIDQYFRRRIVVPSPWTDTTPRPKNLVSTCLVRNSCEKGAIAASETPVQSKDFRLKGSKLCKTRNISCQTDLSLPMNLPDDLEKLLANYTQPQRPESPELDSSSHSSSLRRKLNFNESYNSNSDTPTKFLSAQMFQESEITEPICETFEDDVHDLPWDTSMVGAPSIQWTPSKDNPTWSVSPVHGHTTSGLSNISDIIPCSMSQDNGQDMGSSRSTVFMSFSETMDSQGSQGNSNQPDPAASSMKSPYASSPIRFENRLPDVDKHVETPIRSPSVSPIRYKHNANPTFNPPHKDESMMQWDLHKPQDVSKPSRDASMDINRGEDTGYQTCSFKSYSAIDHKNDSVKPVSMMWDEDSIL